LVHERLDALPARARDVLALAAARPEPSVETIERGLGESIDEALRAAVEAQIVSVVEGHVRFAHPLLANAASVAVDETRLRQARRRLADVVTDPVLRANQLALAADAPDEEVATALEEAAGVALGRGTPATSAELLERASQLTPTEDESAWARRLTAAGDAHAKAGDEGRGQALWGEVVSRARPGPARAAALGELARQRLDLDAIEQARAEMGDDLRLRAWLDFIRLFVVASRGSYRAAANDAYAAVASAEIAGDPAVLVQTLSMLAHLETVAGIGDPLGHLTRAAELVSQGVVVQPFFSPTAFLGRHYVVKGELGLARVCFEEADQTAEDEGDEESHAQLLVFLAELEWRAGNFQRAKEFGQELIDFLDQGGEELVGRQIMRLGRIVAEAQIGDLAAARTEAEAGLAEAQSLGAKFWEGKLRAALGVIEVTAGDHQAAVHRLAPMAALEDQAGVGDPCVWMYAADELEALVAVGHLDEAATKLRRLERRGTELDRPWILVTAARCRGLLEAARGELSRGLDAFARALEEHERLPMPFERARTLFALGQVQRRAKQKRAARESLGSALAIFEELGAKPWVEKTHAELARIGGRAPTGGLTPTEQRIAELVAKGRSNKEVAAELFVTVKTVESNLTRIYAKLEVRSRTELARKLGSK
jgi:DNA-binding CsgD family transcriptional regulator